jgi:hypothetical protein
MTQPVQPGAPAPQPAPKKGVTWIIILAVAVPVLLAVCGVVSALAIYGVRRYVQQAKNAEAGASLPHLGQAIATCANAEDASGQRAGLPESSPAVPATLADVGGRKYQSSPAEWGGPDFTCPAFNVAGPQYFQYQWVKTDQEHGVVRALGDLDGDGAPEAHFEVQLLCSAGGCESGQVLDIAAGP